jgi:2-isopropylmalate synthase
MNVQDKIVVARKLEQLGVDVIEAGFPISSPGDLESVKTIAGMIKGSSVAGLCRALEKDIDAAREALEHAAAPPRIHIFLATSPIHMEWKLKMKPDEVLERAVSAVKYAKRFCSDVEYSAEDASRSDRDFLCKVLAAVIEAGATTVNIPDTTGYAMPVEFGDLIKYVAEHTPGIEKAVISCHVHNDLGLAVANSLAAISGGAGQVECTINGIGERAGNASLEEIVMALRVRSMFWDADTKIDTTQIYTASLLVTQVTGVKVQPNKAIVGENAFAHEAGVHQHGVLANRATYEIMTPESIGIPYDRMVLGKHSGRHAVDERLVEEGYIFDEATRDIFFARFKAMADKGKGVSDRDFHALAMDLSAPIPETWTIDTWFVNSVSGLSSTSTVKLRHKDGTAHKETGVGDGPIEAAFKAIDHITRKPVRLEHYELGAITGGKTAQGETMVKIERDGKRWNGRGVSLDILESSIRAYVAAINAMEAG